MLNIICSEGIVVRVNVLKNSRGSPVTWAFIPNTEMNFKMYMTEISLYCRLVNLYFIHLSTQYSLTN